MLYLSWVLFCFEASSGLKINLEKNELILVGRMDNVEVLEIELGYRIGSLSSTYLGLPLGAGHKAMTVWDSVEEQMRKRLALWKRSYISKGGRITLIKSSLASLPLYQMSLVRMPVSVVKRLEKLQRSFLWEGGCVNKETASCQVGSGVHDERTWWLRG